jgi:hypothetical protein
MRSWIFEEGGLTLTANCAGGVLSLVATTPYVDAFWLDEGAATCRVQGNLIAGMA